MLAGLGAFAGGLSDGIRKNQDLALKNRMLDRQDKADERDTEVHQAKMDDFNFNKKQRDSLQKSNDIIAAEYTRRLAAQNQPVVADTRAPGLNMVASIPPQTSDVRALGLADIGKPAPTMPSDQFIQKQMLTGNLARDPDMLTFMAKTYAENGHGDKMLPYLEKIHEAKQKGFVDALPHLMSKNGAGAAEALRRAGIPIDGDLTLVDPKTMTWKGKVNGVDQELNTRDIFGASNPSEWFKMQSEQPEREAKINALNANAEKDRATGQYYLGAKTNEAAARAGRYDRMGLGSDKPEKIDAAIKRRDAALDALSSVTGDDGKPFVDPQKRMTYSSLSVDAEQAVSDMLGGRDLTAREQHALTDMIRTAPLGDAQGMAQWAKQLQQRFGGKQVVKTQGGLDTPRPIPQASAALPGELREPVAANPSPGSLAQRRPEDLAQSYKGTSHYDEMLSVQRALQSPNLGPEQRRVLALRANEISSNYAKQYGR